MLLISIGLLTSMGLLIWALALVTVMMLAHVQRDAPERCRVCKQGKEGAGKVQTLRPSCVWGQGRAARRAGCAAGSRTGVC